MSEMSHNGSTPAPAQSKPGAGMIVLLIVSWLWVGLPLAWGVSNTIQKSLPLFQMAAVPESK